jgi:hypothetical protein
VAEGNKDGAAAPGVRKDACGDSRSGGEQDGGGEPRGGDGGAGESEIRARGMRVRESPCEATARSTSALASMEKER